MKSMFVMLESRNCLTMSNLYAKFGEVARPLICGCIYKWLLSRHLRKNGNIGLFLFEPRVRFPPIARVRTRKKTTQVSSLLWLANMAVALFFLHFLAVYYIFTFQAYGGTIEYSRGYGRTQ